MCLDFDTKIVLAEELEDVAMELANISQRAIPDASDKVAVTLYFQSIQAETERLSDITELYEYNALMPIALWANQNVLALKNNIKKLSKSNEAGLFTTWIELLAALLQQLDHELSSELKTALLDPHWEIPVDTSSVQHLLDSLSPNTSTHTTTDQKDDLPSAEQVIITPRTESASQTENAQTSSYRLAPDDDVHPELLDAFYIETPDQVIEVAELIRQISEGNSDKAIQQSAARLAHTIKGSSAVIGLEPVARFAHRLEDILEYSIEYPLPPEVADLLVESSDCLEAMFDSLITQSLPPQHYPQLLEQLTQWDQKFSTGYLYQPSATEQLNATTNETDTPQAESTPQANNTQTSSYRLSPDDDVHPELLDAFYIETPDQVIEVAELIRQISEGNPDKAMQQSAARLAHTIKGSSAVIGLEPVASFAHRLEDILEYSVEHPLPPEVADLLVESSDCLESMFDSLITQSLPPQHYPQLLEQLTQWDQKFSTGYLYQSPVAEQFNDKSNETNTLNKRTPQKNTTNKTNSSYELGWDKNIHPELLEAYMGETPEYVVDISKLLREITQQTHKDNQKNPKDLKKAYQTASTLAHIIKGTSATVGINAVANIGQPLEEILDYAADNALPSSLFPLLDESADLLESLYDSLLSEGIPPKEYPALHKKLCAWQDHLVVDSSANNEHIEVPFIEAPQKDAKQVKKDQTTPVKTESNLANVDEKPSLNLRSLDEIRPTATVAAPTTQRTGLNEAILRVPVSIIDQLLSFSSELITTNTQMADQINTLLSDRKNSNERNERIRSMLDELEWAVNQQNTSSRQTTTLRTPNNNSPKTNVLKIDSLELDSYNELYSITNLLSESIEDDRKTSIALAQQLHELKAQAQSQKQLNNELNNTVLNMRMEAAKLLSPRLQRIVRETCRQTKKQAKLDIIGDEVALDTDIIKGLSDPLLHLLRNAVDHGIESEKTRLQQAKNKIGNIELRFIQQGDHVVLILKDDGAGIDADKVYQSALKKGLINEEKTLSKEEKLRLILLAGFSTRNSVSETSGRGVGMDVVNSAVQNLSGNIVIESKKNQGTEIRIQVPLTLSVANVLLVDVLGNTLAIPNASIEQVYYVPQHDIKEKKGKLFIYYQQQDIPVLALSTLLSWPTSRLIIDKSQSVLMIKHRNQHYALYVDKILKPLNITIKTLKPWMTNITGVNGVCLLPNGVVAPVLNLFDVLRTALQDSLKANINITDSASININQNKILVVDDSLSNRTALRLMLESLGHEVGTAVDGADALQQLEKTPFKLVMTDLEMPNMNGLELVEALRVWAETKHLPIVMITSRSTSKHRTLALQAGVDDYLTKPVDNNTLQATVDKYTASE